MIIEDLSRGGLGAVHDRFEHQGRMLPDGVKYLSSWIEEDGNRCFQLMEAEDPALLDQWAARWFDIVSFEIVPVVPSADFWKRRGNP
jgi:hypothetical protein